MRILIREHSGLYSFASTTLVLSLVNVQAKGVTHANVVVGMAIFVGGLVQLLAGMWEFAVGNTFGATGERFLPSFRSCHVVPPPSVRFPRLSRCGSHTSNPTPAISPLPTPTHSHHSHVLSTAFSSYGGFWMSYAIILWPSSGVLAAYKDNERELRNALAIYLTAWFIFTFLMLYVHPLFLSHCPSPQRLRAGRPDPLSYSLG